jgi:hypothetical protein
MIKDREKTTVELARKKIRAKLILDLRNVISYIDTCINFYVFEKFGS